MSIAKYRLIMLITGLLTLLTLLPGAYANTDMFDSNNTGNPDHYFKLAKQAQADIAGLEKTIGLSKGKAKESALVELAQTLDYYLTLPPAQIRQKPQARQKIRNQMLSYYLEAAVIAGQNNQIRYTGEIADLAVRLQKKALLDSTFSKMLTYASDTKGTYLALMDYADGLAKFSDNAADEYFQLAVSMRNPVDGVEAHFRYANYLLNHNQAAAALQLLDKFTFDERNRYVHVAILRQKIIHILGLDSTAVDAEIDALREKMSQGAFIGRVPKTAALSVFTPINTLSLTPAHAFVHRGYWDDSRGWFAHFWYRTPSGYLMSRVVINAAEVLYNEARGEQEAGRLAVAWAIRNRANIDMNGCDFYPGAQGQGHVEACRKATRGGPQSATAAVSKRYSCVIHGGTTRHAASHYQMNDAHVAIASLESSGLLWEIIDVFNGWVPDRTSETTPAGTFYPGRIYPANNNLDAGNPAGAQEWRSNNYCAARSECKTRLGNVGGDRSDPGDACPQGGGGDGDNFFWGRKPDKK